MSLFETRFGANATGLPAPAPLPSLTTAFSRRAAILGAAASAGVLAGSGARCAAAPIPSPVPVGPLTLAQAEAVDFAALWASLSPEAQARIGALALEAETLDQVALDGGFHTTAEDRDEAQTSADAVRNAMPAVIWAALPTVLPTTYDEPYQLWQVLEGRDSAPAEVDVRGLGRRALVKDGWQWFAAVGGVPVELGGAVDLDSRIPDAPHRWQFWTVADIDAERLRRHPEMAGRGGAS